MKEVTLRLTDEEFEVLDSFRRGRAREFVVSGDDVTAVDDGGGFIFSNSEYFEGGSGLIAAAFNGLFRSGA